MTSDHDGHALLGGDDPSDAHGAAIGTLGVGGWFAWRTRRRTRDAVDSVSPGTWRGAVHVTLWLLGLVAITVAVGQLLTPVGGFAVGLVVMVAVGWWWDRRTERRAARRGPFA